MAGSCPTRTSSTRAHQRQVSDRGLHYAGARDDLLASYVRAFSAFETVLVRLGLNVTFNLAVAVPFAAHDVDVNNVSWENSNVEKAREYCQRGFSRVESNCLAAVHTRARRVGIAAASTVRVPGTASCHTLSFFFKLVSQACSLDG